jgi:phosphohistidine swiveling domain-containing protein
MQLGRSKAEMLLFLRRKNFPVPPLTYFTLAEWDNHPNYCLSKINVTLGDSAKLLAIRSSSIKEDNQESSMAGAFQSLLNIPASDNTRLKEAIDEVRSFLTDYEDQIIIQTMVENVSMSGVVFTHTLDFGSPYYVINYDDATGRTDTVTGGKGVSKTVYIYRQAKTSDFISLRLAKVLELVRSIEQIFLNTPLDIEFAVDENNIAYLLQVRPISTVNYWNNDVAEIVSKNIDHIALFVRKLMTPRKDLFGKDTILGVMPDWNPAEMISVLPKPLALSLYREFITRRTWSEARQIMGYRHMPPVELMVSVGGRPYIDVRASFNSFLPEGIQDNVGEKLVNAWLDRLRQYPAFHDKIEFEIVPTILEPGFKEKFSQRYGQLLTKTELKNYELLLKNLTFNAMSKNSSLDNSLALIAQLKSIQDKDFVKERKNISKMSRFDLSLRLANTIEQCRTLGTLPFAAIARHGFIAETWLRAAIANGALEQRRVEELKRSIKTVSSELSNDFNLVLSGLMPKKTFLELYGHLRPGAYDITSASYRERTDLFDVNLSLYSKNNINKYFNFTTKEIYNINKLLNDSNINIDSKLFYKYIEKAVYGREYAKFIFTRHLDFILDIISTWGKIEGYDTQFTKEDLSMLPIDEFLSICFKPLPELDINYFFDRIEQNKHEYKIGKLFKLSYIIRSFEDVYIVPQHRSEPNFIGSKSIIANVVVLDTNNNNQDLNGSIICIESADPGYDWIFTRNIAGLITRYGGTNSHMAIRCAEYGLPAAIGCGEHLFLKACSSKSIILNCATKTILTNDNMNYGLENYKLNDSTITKDLYM